MPKRKLDPLPTAAFHILLALAEDDLHGYAIMQRVAEETGGKVRLGPGTLYGSIKTLLEEGCIRELGERTDPKLGSARRRYYRLTACGRRVVHAEISRLNSVLRLAKSKHIPGSAHG